MMSDELRCKDILQDLSLYIDHEASVMLCEEIERHLAHCTDCRVVVDTLRRTVSLYQTLPKPEMPEHLRERLYRTFQLESLLPDHLVVSEPDAENHDDNRSQLHESPKS